MHRTPPREAPSSVFPMGRLAPVTLKPRDKNPVL